MIRRLREARDEWDDPRAELDASLGVASWEPPWVVRPRAKDVPSGAPSWWLGDEEATSSFLRGMGVQSVEQLGLGVTS
jgi:hypothetical protein